MNLSPEQEVVAKGWNVLKARCGMTLSVEQQSVVDSDSPSKFIVAGPGSGKTRVLVALIVKELTRTPAQQIACISFTNAAADELRERVAKECRDGARGIWCGTIHSFLFNLMRQFPEHSGMSSNIAMVEPDTAAELLEQVRAEMGIKGISKLKLETVVNDPLHIEHGARLGGSTKEELLAREFHVRLKESGLMTFQSLLVIGKKLVGALRDEHKFPYKAIIWDEFQDSGYVDNEIMDDMSAERLVVAGDPDQSIFGFRGAYPDGFIEIANLAKTAAKAKLFLLSDNYRCSTGICKAANDLIAHNENRVPKETVAITTEAGLVTVTECPDQAHELRIVLSWVIASASPDHGYGGYAVLARTRARAKVFSDFLQGSGIPVQSQSVEEVEMPKDWKRTKLLLTAAAAPWSDMAVKAYIAEAEGAGTAEAVARGATKRMVGLADEYFGDAFLDQVASGIFIPQSLSWFLEKHLVSKESSDQVLRIAEQLGGRYDLRNLAASLGQKPEPKPSEQDAVFVGTVHSAKGREWETVIVVGCEEGTFPSRKSKTTEETEEERRLMYVAVTRAKRRLIFTWCQSLQPSRGPNLPPGPAEARQRSRFLDEMNL